MANFLGMEHDEITKEMIEKKTLEMTRAEAVEFYINMGLACAPVYHVDEAVADPHLAAREMLIEVEHPKAGTVKVPNFPVKLSETPGVIKTAAPLLGQNSKEILIEVLGYSEEKVMELVKAGVTPYPRDPAS